MNSTSAPKIFRGQGSCSAPLSFAQQRLWLLNQLEPGNPAYNMPVAVHLKGSLNVTALEQSLGEIVRRHEALRTTFATVDGRPLQAIASTHWTLPIVDLRGISETERQTECHRLIVEEATRPFDLTQSPLLRGVLQRLGEEEYILLLTIHQIVCDDWSFGVLFRELTILYEAFSLGLPSPLPELPIQYVDFAVWQRRWLQGEVLVSGLDYWKQQLGGQLPVLECKSDRPRPPVKTYQGARQSLELIPKTLTDALKAFSQQQGVSVFMTLLAAFKTLLYRYTGQSDILVGSPIANRNSSEIEGLIGLFVNTLVMRTYLGGNPSFQELLARVREVALGAYAHQDLPFEKLVEELQPERDLSHTPLFQVMFVWQDTPMPRLELPGLSISPMETPSSGAKFDLLLSMEETEQELRGFLEYSTDLFDACTIRRMAGHFQTLLTGIVANPQQHLAELPLLTEAERHQLLVEWDTQAEYACDRCIHQLFEEQVERTPDAVAVVFENQQLTYRELNCRANKIAHYLQALGVKPEVLVGICVERSIEMVVGLLGILKAGGAYVPIDPTYPKERLGFMFTDSQVTVLLTQKKLVEQLPEHGAHVVCLDTDWEVICETSDENSVSDAKPLNLAYVIYTSGSTGQPKGVMIQHHSLVNFTEQAGVEYALKSGDRVLQFASISFDAAVEEIFPCLVRGGTLVLRTDSMLSSVPTFLERCRALELTVLDLPTAFWHQVTAELSEGLQMPESVRLVIIGGEKALTDRLATWQQHVSDRVLLMNTYGPTEATVVATMCNLSQSTAVAPILGEIPIGQAIRNVKTYLLDQHLQPVPIGVPGELYIGGLGLARGYLNRPDLTAERFIPDSFSNKPGARLYKTGDRVRYLPNGDIEYLDRIDYQVKIRGLRIELGEVEAVLNQHPLMQTAVVIVREDIPGEKRLVAYLVAKEQPAPPISELRNFLKQKLPDYMVPSAFIMLDTLPLLPNGKVDRRTLPAPDTTRPDLERAFVAPQDALELELTKMWEKVLGIQPIGVEDNFFELGGNSLLGVRLFAQIEKIFGKNLPLATLFQAPTIKQLAKLLSQEGCQASRSSLLAIQPSGSKPPLFFFYGLGGNPLEFCNLTYHLGLEQPVYGWEPDVKQAISQTRISDMAAHCIKELLTIQPEGPYFLGGYCSGGAMAFEVAQQLHAQGHKVALLALIDYVSPILDEFESKKLWQPGFYIDFLWNLAYVLSDFLQDSPSQQFNRIRSKLNSFSKKISRLVLNNPDNKSVDSETEVTIDNILSVIPDELHEEHRKFFKHQMQAVLDYIPAAYPGSVTFFLSRRWSFPRFRNKIKTRWSKMAAGVEIRMIPGSHIDTFKEPYVQVLAEQLRACLDSALLVEADGNTFRLKGKGERLKDLNVCERD